VRREVIGVKCTFPDGRFVYENLDEAWDAWHRRDLAYPKWDVSFSSACSVMWDEPKRPKWLVVLGYIVAAIVGIANLAVMFSILFALPAWFTDKWPVFKSQIKESAKLIYNSLFPAGSTVHKALNWISEKYQAWIKPALTWVHDQVTNLINTVNELYGMTVKNLVDIYNNIFGWVDALRKTVNGVLDNVGAIATVLGLDPNGKLAQWKQEFNEFLDKWFVDWFDKILNKISEYVGPVLTKVNELGVAITNVTDMLITRFGPAEDFVKDMNTGSAVDEVDTADAIDTTTQHPPEETTPAGEEAAKEYKPEPEKESAFDRLMDKYAAKIYNTAEKFMDMVDASIDLTEEEIKQSSWMQLYYPDDDVLALDEGSFANDFFLYLLGDLNFADLMRYHWKEVIFHQKRFNTRQEAIDYYSEIWQEMERSGVPERKIEKAKKKDMKRINDMFPVPERGF